MGAARSLTGWKHGLAASVYYAGVCTVALLAARLIVTWRLKASWWPSERSADFWLGAAGCVALALVLGATKLAPTGISDLTVGALGAAAAKAPRMLMPQVFASTVLWFGLGAHALSQTVENPDLACCAAIFGVAAASGVSAAVVATQLQTCGNIMVHVANAVAIGLGVSTMVLATRSLAVALAANWALATSMTPPDA